jgi:hypothetical protein
MARRQAAADAPIRPVANVPGIEYLFDEAGLPGAAIWAGSSRRWRSATATAGR